jgi:hypothetical protein
MTSEGIEGVVVGTAIQSWLPKSERSGWTIDPLVLDASFQLAAFWLQSHRNRVGFPVGFDRLTLLRPFGDKPILCRLRVREVTEESFAGDIFYTDDLGTPFALLENVRGRFAEVREPAAVQVPKENWDIGQRRRRRGDAQLLQLQLSRLFGTPGGRRSGTTCDRQIRHVRICKPSCIR